MHKPYQDSMDMFFRDVDKYPLLTKQKEKSLFESFVTCRDKLTEKKGIHFCGICEEPRKEIAAANLRLVISIANKYLSKNKKLDPIDYIQMGNEGLIKAIWKFDVTTGNKFSTYATWWIRQAVSRGAISEGSTVRIPISTYVDDAKKLKREGKSAISLFPVELSTDQPVQGCERHTVYGDSFTCDRESVLNAMVKETEGNAIHVAWGRLNTREKFVIEARYMGDDDKLVTLQNIGDEIGLTREGVRMIEKKAVEKMRGLMSCMWKSKE